MTPWIQLSALLLLLPYAYSEPIPLLARPVPAPVDPCATIAGQKWVLPAQARACIRSFPLLPEIKDNIIEVVNKTLAFHTSTNYQVQAPPPYDQDVHEDLHADLARIARTDYDSEFDFHLDVYLSFKRVNDGHCGVYSRCFDSLYVSYIPLPLSLLTEEDGSQNVYISSEAFTLASAEFADSLDFWQEALPGDLKGHLELLSGAKVLAINGADPFVAVNANADIAGSYQAFGTRQNGFFASYHRGAKGWEYYMGNFATLVHPLVDSVELTVALQSAPDSNVTFTMPYRSRFGSSAKNFTDATSLRANNCFATAFTNGLDLYESTSPSLESSLLEAGGPDALPIAAFQQQPALSVQDYLERHALNVILDAVQLADIELPVEMVPALEPLNSSYSVAEFFMLPTFIGDGVNGDGDSEGDNQDKPRDSDIGVLALGSFSAQSFNQFGQSLLDGLKELKAKGAEKLIVDVTNNGGGYICIAHWLHRLIAGPKSTTIPQAGLDTTLRAGPLAQLIAEKVANGSDPEGYLHYNAVNWNNATHQPFPQPKEQGKAEWFEPRKVLVNGREDAFSQRLGSECQPFKWEAPEEAMFSPKNVVIVSNGRCASSCSLFSITMAKEEGVRTIVVGGKADVQQHYCGIVGGQSTDYSMIDTEIKSTKLKDHPLSPPDFLTNSVQGITWRLGYGINDPAEPEGIPVSLSATPFLRENASPPTQTADTRGAGSGWHTPVEYGHPTDRPPFLPCFLLITPTSRLDADSSIAAFCPEWQDHSASINFPVTKQTVNRPLALWEAIARQVFEQNEHSPASESTFAPAFVVQQSDNY